MKTLPKLLLLVLFALSNMNLQAQKLELDPVSDPSTKEIVLTKNDGTEYIGVILEQDDREVLLLTKSIGRLYIPKHEIESISEITSDDYREGVYMGNNMFATRYVITTNGLPMKKGETYAMIQLYGAEFQTAVSKNLTIGAITTWGVMPLIGSVKASFSASDKIHFAVGTLVGSGTWLSPRSYGAIGYGSLTFGDHVRNISFTAGYAGFSIYSRNNDTRTTNSSLLLSVAGLVKVSNKITFVGDSFIYPGDNPWALVIPALRFKQKAKGEFQFGLGMLVAQGELLPVPIPMISWFRKF
jgi:hypothetical protein